MHRRLNVLAVVGLLSAGALALLLVASHDDGVAPEVLDAQDALVARGPADFDAIDPGEIEHHLLDAVVGWARLVSVDERDGDNFRLYSAEDVERWVVGDQRDHMLQRVAEIDGYNWRTRSDVSVVGDRVTGFARLTPVHIVALACLDYSFKAWFRGSLGTDERSVEEYLFGLVRTPDGWRIDAASSIADCD